MTYKRLEDELGLVGLNAECSKCPLNTRHSQRISKFTQAHLTRTICICLYEKNLEFVEIPCLCKLFIGDVEGAGVKLSLVKLRKPPLCGGPSVMLVCPTY